jgi:hypothetical protein
MSEFISELNESLEPLSGDPFPFLCGLKTGAQLLPKWVRPSHRSSGAGGILEYAERKVARETIHMRWLV